MRSDLSLLRQHELACQVLREVNPMSGLTPAVCRKLETFLELTSDVGLSKEGRELSNSLSSIVGHLDDRPLSVTRRLVSDLLKRGTPHGNA